MTLLLRTAVVVLLGLVLVACGGGGGGDEGAIRDVFRDFFTAFEDGDEVKLAGLLNDDCLDSLELAENAIQSYLARGLDSNS